MAVASAPRSRPRQVFFWMVFTCSEATCAVACVFFIIGLGDGSVSSSNLGLWSVILAVMGISLWAAISLRTKGKDGLAIAALAVTAIPGLLAALFLLLLLITQPRWN